MGKTTYLSMTGTGRLTLRQADGLDLVLNLARADLETMGPDDVPGGADRLRAAFEAIDKLERLTVRARQIR